MHNGERVTHGVAVGVDFHDDQVVTLVILGEVRGTDRNRLRIIPRVTLRVLNGQVRLALALIHRVIHAIVFGDNVLARILVLRVVYGTADRVSSGRRRQAHCPGAGGGSLFGGSSLFTLNVDRRLGGLYLTVARVSSLDQAVPLLGHKKFVGGAVDRIRQNDHVHDVRARCRAHQEVQLPFLGSFREGRVLQNGATVLTGRGVEVHVN